MLLEQRPSSLNKIYGMLPSLQAEMPLLLRTDKDLFSQRKCRQPPSWESVGQFTSDRVLTRKLPEGNIYAL